MRLLAMFTLILTLWATPAHAATTVACSMQPDPTPGYIDMMVTGPSTNTQLNNAGGPHNYYVFVVDGPITQTLGAAQILPLTFVFPSQGPGTYNATVDYVLDSGRWIKTTVEASCSLALA